MRDIEEFESVYMDMFNSRNITENIVSGVAAQLNKNQEYQASSRGSILEITKKADPQQVPNYFAGTDFIDLKAYFAKSGKAKRKKNGGWYLIVPIGISAKVLRKASWDTYKTISHDAYGATESFGDDFQSIVQGEMKSGMVNASRYEWKSSNVTRVHKGKRAGYISFRTVSDTSDPNSWLVPVQRNFKLPTSTPQMPKHEPVQLSLDLGSAIEDQIS